MTDAEKILAIQCRDTIDPFYLLYDLYVKSKQFDLLILLTL